MRGTAAVLVVALVAVLSSCSSPAAPSGAASTATSTGASATPTPTPKEAAQSVAEADMVAAGDIASCSSSGDEATANLVDRISGVVATLGDTVYPNGSTSDFARCYRGSWGRFKSRTRPAVGNHEYQTDGAVSYFDYFGAAAGDRRRGYYSYDLGSWHVIVLNSNCGVAGCTEGSRQERWLRANLRAAPRRCTLAYWHHPYFTSGGEHPPLLSLRPLVQDLYDAGVELALTGHNHNYERFAPQNPSGRLDRARGIRAFVVGTGGASHYKFGSVRARNSELRNDSTYGVLRLTLRADGYTWRFVPVKGSTFTDSGTGTCH
jgi:hypothetical protein